MRAQSKDTVFVEMVTALTSRNMASNSIVVARYREDVSWTNAMTPDYEIVVYNKSEGGNLLPNVGREAHTYLHHIVQTYDEIARNPTHVTFFCQGGLLDHARDFRHYIAEATTCALKTGFSYVHADFHAGLGIYTAHYDYRMLEYPPGQPLHPNAYNMTFGCWWQHVTGLPFPAQPIKWVVAANFAVRHDKIIMHPKTLYCRLLGELSDHDKPETAHFMERAWCFLFSYADGYVPQLAKVRATTKRKPKRRMR